VMMRCLFFFVGFMACSQTLPALIANTNGSDDECDTHRDCSLLEPQCLAGRCTESDATAVLVSHLNRPELLGESRSIHALQLARFNQGMDLARIGDWQAIEGTSWWERHGDDGVSFVAHHSGLVAVAVNDGSWAALAQPNDLRTSHPFRRLDLRAFIGGDRLRDLVQQFVDFGFLPESEVSRTYGQADHSLIMSQEKGHLVTEIAFGKVSNRLVQRLGIPTVINLLARTSPSDTSINPFSDSPPEAWIGRTFVYNTEVNSRFRLSYQGEGTLELNLQVNGQRHEIQQMTNSNPSELATAVFEVPMGRHEISIQGSTQELSFFRLEITAPGRLHLESWRSLHGRLNEAGEVDDEEGSPMDRHARPRVLYFPKGLILDRDGDGWPDESDLCPNFSDHGEDSDQDGRGDACDGVVRLTARDDAVLAIDRQGETLFRDLDMVYDEITWRLAQLPHPWVTQSDRSGFAGGVAIQTKTQSSLGEGRPAGNLYLLRKDGQPWGYTSAVENHRITGTSHEGGLTAIDFWNSGANLFTGSTYLIRQYGTQAAIERFDHLSLGVATLPITPRRSFLHMAQEIAQPSLLVAGRYQSPAPVFPDSEFSLDQGLCVDVPMVGGSRCATDAECRPGPRGASIACAGGQCALTCDRSQDCPRGPGDSAMRCLSNFCVPDHLAGFNEFRSTFERCDLSQGGQACDRGLCLSIMDPETNSFLRQLATVARERSTSGWIALVPLAKRQGNRRLFMGVDRGGVTHFDTGETGWRIGLCPDRGLDATSIASPGFLSDFLAHFVGAGQVTPELNFVPGMINDSANMCIAYKGGLMSFGKTLTPRQLRLVDLDGDGVEEVRMRASLAADASITAGTVYRCFDYRGMEVEQGCEP